MLHALYINRRVCYIVFSILLLQYFLIPEACAQKQSDTVSIMKLISKGEQEEHSQPDSALIIYHEALTESEHAQFANGIVTIFAHTYDLYTSKGLYDSVLSLLQNTLTICEKSDRLKSVTPIIYNQMGNVYLSRDKYEIAMQFYTKAIAYAEKYNLPSSGAVYNNLAAVLLKVYRYDEALPYLDKAEKISRQVGNYKILGYALMNKGVAYMYLKKWNESQQCYEQAIDISRKHKILQVLYLSLTNLSDAYIIKKMPEKALPYLLETQSLKGDVDPYYQSIAVRDLGTVYQQLHNYKNAEFYLRKALVLTDKYQLPKSSSDIHLLLARLYAETKQYEQAYTNLQLSVTIDDSIQDLNINQNLSQLEVKFRTAEKDKEIIQKKLLISEQDNKIKKKNLWIGGISVGALLILGLLIGVYKYYRHKQDTQARQIYILKQEQEIEQLKAMMNGEERERTRIAQELHDGIGGMLAATKMNFSAMKKEHPELSDIKAVDEIMYMLQSISSEVRKTAHNLMPEILSTHSLSDAVRWYCGKITTKDNLQIDLQFYGDIDHLGNLLTLTLYRILQELIQNIIKHAHATQAVINLMLYERTISLTVEDNGIGFDTDEKANGFGLKNIYYRIKALQGTLSINSVKGKGTTIYIEIENPE